MRHEVHPACAAWPRPSEAKFQVLVADIHRNGLLNPMWLTPDGLMLDGKTREEACEQLGIEGRYLTYTGDDPIAFVISQNKVRRHVTEVELAFVGEELATLKQGRPSKLSREKLLSETAEQVAEQLGIHKLLISNVRTLKREGEPNIIALVRSGKVGIKNATPYVLHTPREEQRSADAETVKKEGALLRTPKKNKPRITISGSDAVGGANERLIAVDTVIKILRPLVREVKDQASRHPATVSFTALHRLGSYFDQIFKAWASGDDAAVRRISEHLARAEIRKETGYYAASSNPDDPTGEQRDTGSYPATRR